MSSRVVPDIDIIVVRLLVVEAVVVGVLAVDAESVGVDGPPGCLLQLVPGDGGLAADLRRSVSGCPNTPVDSDAVELGPRRGWGITSLRGVGNVIVGGLDAETLALLGLQLLPADVGIGRRLLLGLSLRHCDCWLGGNMRRS